MRTVVPAKKSEGLHRATAACHQLSDLAHQRSCLSILAALREVGRAKFISFTEVTGLTDGDLSRHPRVLAESNLVSIGPVGTTERKVTLRRMNGSQSSGNSA